MSAIVLEQKFKIINESGQETLVETQEIKQDYSTLETIKRVIGYSDSTQTIYTSNIEFDYLDFASDISVYVTIYRGVQSIFSGNAKKITSIGGSNSGQYRIDVQNPNQDKDANINIILGKE